MFIRQLRIIYKFDWDIFIENEKLEAASTKMRLMLHNNSNYSVAHNKIFCQNQGTPAVLNVYIKRVFIYVLVKISVPETIKSY
jgi:hypothetical protein